MDSLDLRAYVASDELRYAIADCDAIGWCVIVVEPGDSIDLVLMSLNPILTVGDRALRVEDLQMIDDINALTSLRDSLNGAVIKYSSAEYATYKMSPSLEDGSEDIISEALNSNFGFDPDKVEDGDYVLVPISVLFPDMDMDYPDDDIDPTGRRYIN